MKVAQHIHAGRLTGSWISYDESVQLTFGDDEVRFDIDESQLRELSERLLVKIREIEEKRENAKSEADG